MSRTTSDRTSAYALTWSLEVTPGEHVTAQATLKLLYEVEAFEELYISDRLWTYDASHQRVPDPYGVYRFVRDDSLRLVFAQAPRAPNVSLRVLYQPLYSRVRAGEKRRGQVSMRLPIDEYSSLARDVDAPSVVDEVSSVVFVMGVRLRATLELDPEPPPNESAEDAGYIVHGPQLIISGMRVDPLPVRRRTGYMARFALPGEPKPAPTPPRRER